MSKTISVNIMTLNEERVIERCIKSIYNIADEIIIIDTGSTDKTVEKIEKFGGNKIKLFFKKWNNNFAEIRNLMIEYSTMDIIFQIDADEYLIDEYAIQDMENQLKRINKNEVGIPRIININGIEIGSGPVRIFENFCGYYYFGKIHEEIRNDSRFNKVMLDLPLYHDGYLTRVINEKNKGARNIKLSREMIDIEPNNPRWRFYYIRDLFYHSKDKLNVLKEAEVLKKRLEHEQSEDERNIVEYLEFISTYIEIVYTDKEKFNLDQLENKYPWNIDIFFLKLLLFQKKIKIESFELNKFFSEYKVSEKRKSFFDINKSHINYLFFESYYMFNDLEKVEYFFGKLRNDLKKNIYLEKVKKLKRILKNNSE